MNEGETPKIEEKVAALTDQIEELRAERRTGVDRRTHYRRQEDIPKTCPHCQISKAQCKEVWPVLIKLAEDATAARRIARNVVMTALVSGAIGLLVAGFWSKILAVVRAGVR